MKDIKLRNFPLNSYDKIRYQDTDKQGHVNNAIFPVYFETGRLELLYNPNDLLHDEGYSYVLANIHIDLIKEIHYPGIVHIGTKIKKIGNSSIHFEQALFQGESLAATSTSIVVHVSNQTKKSYPLPEKIKSKLNQYL